MAIQHRRGSYSDFDTSKMQAGEIAVVQSGDMNTDDGSSIYVGITDGHVKRLVTGDENLGGGSSVSSITQYYQRTSTATNLSSSTGTWSTTPGTLSSGQWLWTYFKLTMTDGTTKNSEPICIGNYNARLSSVSLYQLRNTSSTAPSSTASGWSTTNYEPTSSAPYVWGCLRFIYYPTNSSSSHTVYSNVFRLKTYVESSTSTASGVVVNVTDATGLNSTTQGDAILAAIQSGLMPVIYDGNNYYQTIRVGTIDSCGTHYLQMVYFGLGCSSTDEYYVQQRVS